MLPFERTIPRCPTTASSQTTQVSGQRCVPLHTTVAVPEIVPSFHLYVGNDSVKESQADYIFLIRMSSFVAQHRSLAYTAVDIGHRTAYFLTSHFLMCCHFGSKSLKKGKKAQTASRVLYSLRASVIRYVQSMF
jgi:hypothetical protein